MKNNMITNFDIKNLNNSSNLLEEVIKDGARKMLQAAIENEVIEFIENNKNMTNEKGHRLKWTPKSRLIFHYYSEHPFF